MALRLSVVTGLVLLRMTSPAAQISLSNSAGQVGGSASSDVLFAAQGSRVAGLQFDIEADAGLTITAASGTVSIIADKSLNSAALSPGTRRFLVVGLNQNLLDDGVIVSLEVGIPADTNVTRQVLHVTNAQATSDDGNAVSLASVDGAISVQGAAPEILTVVNGASFLPSIVDGSWISILGTHLAATVRTLQPDDIVNGQLPTSLAGVRVTVENLPAAISYVSPTQINVQAPATHMIGPVNVVVNTAFGTSTPAQADVRRNAPGVFVFSPEGGRYPAAVIAQADGEIEYLGPAGLFGTAPATRPARPGEVLEIYATALGPTSPAITAGQVFSGAASIVDPVNVTIGGLNAPVAFAGLSGAGLYQLNVRVPTLPPGDQPLSINVNGSVSQPGVFVAVGE